MDDPADIVRDHIIPKCRGGPEASWNIQHMHRRCNGPAGKGRKLTAEAAALAAEHGIVLCEPLPTSWPGSGTLNTHGKPNPYRIAREGDADAPHSVTICRRYEVECRTCNAVIGVVETHSEALDLKREHITKNFESHGKEPAA